MTDETKREANFPWLVFKVSENYFTINSQWVSSIMVLPKTIVAMPDSPKNIRGIIDLRGKIIPLLELRYLFGMQSMMQEYDAFSNMLDQRKQDHLNWVEELERSVRAGESFGLATDPHKCAFGKWYDQFDSNIDSVMHHFKKIEDPHTKLHAAALEVKSCQQNHESCTRRECLKDVFERLSSEYVPQIVSLLDGAKEIFKVSYREMVIVLEKDNQFYGVIADEIIAVEDLTKINSGDKLNDFHTSNYVVGVRQSKTLAENILEVDIDALTHNMRGMAESPVPA